jgi:hypothetical protein
MPAKINLQNQFGETSENYVIGDEQEFVDALPAKAGVEAITAIADPSTATAEDCAEKINEILAALKAV